jgi:hypothetical protein
MFLQAGFPLKITLYRYAPGSSGLNVLGQKGETLDVMSFLEITRSTSTLILVLQKELNELLAQASANWESIEQMAEVA